MTNTNNLKREATTVKAVELLLEAYGYQASDDLEIRFEYEVDASSEYMDVNLNLYTNYTDENSWELQGTERVLTWEGKELPDNEYTSLHKKADKLGRELERQANEYYYNNY